MTLIESGPVLSPRAVVRDSALRSVLRNPLGLTALLCLGVIVIASVLATWIAPLDPDFVRLEMINAAPGGEYLLGGDGAGRDILSRLLAAGRFTLIGAVIAVVVAVVAGVTTGLIAGYFGKWFDSTASWSANVLLAMPAMIVLLALFKALGSSMFMAMVAFGIMLSPGFFRLVRNLVIGVKNELYVDAARVSGLSNGRIIWRHILLVVRAPVVIQVSIVAGIAIVLQSGLEFLGLGDPSIPTWGGMLQDAFGNIYVAPTAIIWPGITIAITVASLVLLGNAVRDGMQRSDTVRRRRRTRTRSSVESVQGTSIAVGEAPRENAILTVRGLRVGYGEGISAKEVVHDVSLDVCRGEVLGLVGESGSGKTQTAFAILGLLSEGGRVTGGSMCFDGNELTTMAASARRALRGKRIAYIPQEPMSNLDPSFRIGYQLVEPIRAVLGISRADAEKKALALLAKVGIPDPKRTFDAYPHEISGGMAQRVLIAGAVACEPDLLIADEVTTALDVTIQAEVLDLLRDLQKEHEMGVILVTHNFGVVADLCDRVAVMQDGRIVETNDVITLFNEPQHEYTRMLLDATLEDSVPRQLIPAEGGTR
ncbi:ATP-binding cassette domain-containing protein [Microbacterium sp. A84]|uniref:ATP-binding cassette domain-containing protein n=1 Tax=Microbacterium sp. A84 TaxID=3450715 RepID=UPI003F425CEE